MYCLTYECFTSCFTPVKCCFFFSSTEEVTSPTDLQFFEVSDKKIVLTWTGPASDVSGYRVVVVPADDSDSPQREMSLPVGQNSYIEVTHLQPGTLYRFSVYTIYNGEESLPLIGEQTTSEFARWPLAYREINTHACAIKKTAALLDRGSCYRFEIIYSSYD